MMLVLRLQTPTDLEPAWATLDGNKPADWTHGSWETLLPLARGQQLLLLIPSREVLLTRTSINTRNQRQLKQAIPYALEDALADDPENQHIVWQAQADSSQVDVAVIERENLRAWIAALQTRQLRAQAILPDVFALPWEADTTTLWQQGEQVWVRTAELSGYACTTHALPLVVESLKAESSPLRLRLYSDQATPWAHDSHLQIIPETQAEQLYASSLQPALKLNLLQGLQDESSVQFRQQWQRWRLAAGLAITAAALTLGMYVFNSHRLQQQLDTTDAENLALFTELFPGAGAIDPRSLKSRVESELLRIKGSAAGKTGSGSPLPSLSAFATALAGTSGIKVEEISSQAETVTIALQATEQQAIETLRETLEKTTGSPVELQSSRTADGVKASLTLGGKS
jgi:type II secretion system protein L